MIRMMSNNYNNNPCSINNKSDSIATIYGVMSTTDARTDARKFRTITTSVNCTTIVRFIEISVLLTMSCVTIEPEIANCTHIRRSSLENIHHETERARLIECNFGRMILSGAKFVDFVIYGETRNKDTTARFYFFIVR
jgi:hypothetical protein